MQPDVKTKNASRQIIQRKYQFYEESLKDKMATGVEGGYCPEDCDHTDLCDCRYSLVLSWICAGGAFSSLRPVVLEEVVEPEFGVFYRTNKKSGSNRVRLPKEISRRTLNYVSINENASRLEEIYPHFDRQVKSEVDLAKVFLEPHMCNFTSLKDCDLLATLALLSKVPVFSRSVQAAAETVRMRVKEWAHCNPGDWDQAKFQQSFREMKQLVGVLPNLASEVRSKLLGNLEFWENICMEKAFFHPPPAKASRTSRFMVKEGNPSNEELEELAQNIRAEDWRKLGRRLNKSDAKLDEFDSQKGVSEKVYQMLLQWKARDGSEATYKVLNDALCHKLVQNRELAEKFCCNRKRRF